MKSTGTNRRAFPRVSTDVPVEIVRPERPDGKTLRGTVQDLSQTGVMLLTSELIPVNEWIMIRPDCKGAGYGAELTAIVERHAIATANEPAAKLICRFPTPIDYGTLQLFR